MCDLTDDPRSGRVSRAAAGGGRALPAPRGDIAGWGNRHLRSPLQPCRGDGMVRKGLVPRSEFCSGWEM